RLERAQHLVRRIGPARVDEHDAVAAELDADVAAGSGEHVEVLADLDGFEPAVLRLERAAGADDRGCQTQRDNKKSLHDARKYINACDDQLLEADQDDLAAVEGFEAAGAAGHHASAC